jgi:hypothetical protein
MKSIGTIKFLTQNLSSDNICEQSNLDQKKEGMNFSEVAAETIEMRNVMAHLLPLQVCQEKCKI